MENTSIFAGPATKQNVSHDEEKMRSDSSPTMLIPEEASIYTEDVLGLQDIDPALNRKMRLVNDVSEITETLQFAG